MEANLRESPLGRRTEYQDTYTPSLLCPIPRWDTREHLEWDDVELPFRGVDIWNCYELTWLDPKGKPLVATAEIHVPAGTKNLVESKSLKLYLGSLCQTKFRNRQEVIRTLEQDIGGCVGGPVLVELHEATRGATRDLADLPGEPLDQLDVEIDTYTRTPALLQVEQGAPVRETVHSHLLRSTCPVTGQPDYASVLVRYHGPQINHRGLLKYIVSYRQHKGFHEQVVEQMFIDILRACQPKGLTVYARFTRRGGIDINPFRSNFEEPLPNYRLWRQ